MKQKKDLALIGIGYWGKNLARNFHKQQVLRTICDKNLANLDRHRSEYPEVNFVTSFEKVLEDPEIKKVAIVTPTAFHYELSKQALLAGKDVFVEKAMCLDHQDAFNLANLAQSRKAILMVGHILQYHPCITYLKKMIKQGELGDIFHLTFSRLNFGSMGEESSALWAFAPHDVSILMELCKDFHLDTVDCKSKNFFSDKHFDQSWIHFDFLEKISADIHVSWLHPYPERKLTIIGSEGTVVFDDLKDWNEKITFWKNSVSLNGTRLFFNRQEEKKIPIQAEEPLYLECAQFLNCCKTRKNPVSDGYEGYRVIRILDAAEKSAAQKKVGCIKKTKTLFNSLVYQ